MHLAWLYDILGVRYTYGFTQGEFHPWVEFAPVSGKTYLSVYMFNRGKISPLPSFRPCLQDRGETHLRVIQHDFNV